MGIFRDSVEIAKKIDSVRTEFIEMRTDFAHLEKSFEKFVELSEKRIDKISNENEDLRRRITKLEAVIDGTLKISMFDAIKSITAEQIQKTGNIDGLDSKSLVKALEENSNKDS